MGWRWRGRRSRTADRREVKEGREGKVSFGRRRAELREVRKEGTNDVIRDSIDSLVRDFRDSKSSREFGSVFGGGYTKLTRRKESASWRGRGGRRRCEHEPDLSRKRAQRSAFHFSIQRYLRGTRCSPRKSHIQIINRQQPSDPKTSPKGG